MTKINTKEIIKDLIETFLKAGEVSINLRKDGLTKRIKSDNTPVSNGDLEVNKIISKKLKELTPSIPIISEETSDNKTTKDLKNFWLIDPIDGTYDYINNKDEFTLNAGLIINKIATAGIIYAPAKNRMFYSYGNNLSYEFKSKFLLSTVSSEIIGISGVIFFKLLKIILLTSISPFVTGVLSFLIYFVKPLFLNSIDKFPASRKTSVKLFIISLIFVVSIFIKLF